MQGVSNRNFIENNENIPLPPPPYTTIIHKIEESDLDRNPPPSYSELGEQPVVYINNYPGPPSTDGYVQGTGHGRPINPQTIISKHSRIYLLLNGILTVILGLAAVGIEIAIVSMDSIIYYYYGFWGGAVIITTGISSVVLYNHRHRIDYLRVFHSFFWQMILAGVVFIIGIIIILTDKCNDNGTDGDDGTQLCKKSYKILNGFLLAIFALAFFQAMISAMLFGILKRKHPGVLNVLS